ncbi:hypothetical protein L596_008124 [Steinernema carpocapsae]|nr:hypothetical protein L596_008124 [Steinernema carpocapsae]
MYRMDRAYYPRPTPEPPRGPPFNGPYRLTADEVESVVPMPNTGRDVVEFRLLVLDSSVGGLIGRQGSNVKRVRHVFGARVSISNSKGGNPEHRVVTISTKADQVAFIIEDIFRHIVPPVLDRVQFFDAMLLAPQSCIGRILGPAGSYIKELRRMTRTYQHLYCDIPMPGSDEIALGFQGEPGGVGEAVAEIVSRLRDYTATSLYDPAYNPMTIHESRKRTHPYS